MAIKEVTKTRYDEMLNILLSRIWLGYGFLAGEPISDQICRLTGNRSAEGDSLTVQAPP